MITLKTPQEIEKMRKAGRVVATTLEALRAAAQVGMTTGDLDELARQKIAEAGAIPSFKGYHGFPGHICASVNEEVVHGIPGNRVLKEGDILSVDLGAIVEGYHGDSAITFPIGSISSEIQLLLQVTEESLYKGIQAAIVGNRLGDVSSAIQTHVDSYQFGIVREFVGHGIGSQMHEDPKIPNYGPPHQGPLLKAGMTLAIEPMVNLGTPDVRILDDQWTVVTRDGKPSAHFEHTILITENGPEILTRP
ncbi:MAG: type I methionyl aminopeptidase [Negativicutes bacterium]|nr:type I methionyl aminopeptidase [Negativicutes bacterium]